MSTQRRKPKNTTGIVILMAVVAVDAALALWAWHRYQNPRFPTTAAAPAASVDSMPGGRPLLPTAPVPQDEVIEPPAYSDAPGAKRGPGALPIAAMPRGPAGLPFVVPEPGAAPAAKPSRESEAQPLLKRALIKFQALKRKPRYRGLNKAWTDEFLKHADLRAANHKFWQDHDVFRFVVSTLRSPNFPKVFMKFARRPELQGFAQDLAKEPSVGQSARVVLEDKKVMAAVKDLRVPGMPSIGALMAQGEKPDRKSLMKDMMEANPEMQKLMNSPGAR